MSIAKRHLSHFIIQPGTVAWIPPAHSEFYIALGSLDITLVLPDYSTAYLRQLDRQSSDIVNDEGRAYAEALRHYFLSDKHGHARRNWLAGISESVSDAAV